MAAQDPQSQPDEALIAAINVTPFVDVVLVLLVIFMVTAPLIAKDILQLRLPKVAAGDGKALSTLGIAVNRDGKILLGGKEVTEDALREEVVRAVRSNADAQAVIAGDVEVPYGRVVRVIDIVKSSGLEKFAVQIERE